VEIGGVEMIPYVHSEKQAELDFMHNTAYTDADRWARNRIEGLSELLDQSRGNGATLRNALEGLCLCLRNDRGAWIEFNEHYKFAQQALAATHEVFQTEKEQDK
jgi:hypothetical protein